MKKILGTYCVVGCLLGVAYVFLIKNPEIVADAIYPMGTAVFISKAVLTDGGFIAIERYSSRDSDVWSVGGTDYMPAGVYTSFHVELNTQQLETYDLYKFILYKDNGDKYLDLAHDTPVRTWYGKEIKQPFTLR